MTNYLTFYDAAFPPADPPATDGVCIYIGGDATHVWTAEEIGMQAARFRLPIYVRDNPGDVKAANADGQEALRELRAIGCPRGSLVAWDMEMAADAAYIQAVFLLLNQHGYKLIVYGSESTVRGNDNPDGLYFGADWTGVPHLHPGDAMTQWVSFQAYDESAAQSTLPFWDTQQQPTPPPAPANWTEALVRELPVLKQGATGSDVRTIQALCVARGQHTKVDGSFGAATSTSVAACQRSAGVTVDSIVGPVTWSVLVTGAAS